MICAAAENLMTKIDQQKQAEIWILEDEPGCQFVYEELLAQSYNVKFFDNIESFSEALTKIDNGKKKVFLTDLLLPDGNFLDYLNNHPEILNHGRYIIVSSLIDSNTLRAGFNKGAYEYILKPFKRSELEVKIERLVALMQKEEITQHVESVLNMNLTLKEQKLLRFFLKQYPNMVTRDELLNDIWKGVIVDPKTIDVHLHNLRKKIISQGVEIRSLGAHQWELIIRPKTN